MAENESYPPGRSPLRRNRPSPRKHPYERNILGGSSATVAKIIDTTSSSTLVRSPLKNIQAGGGSSIAAGGAKIIDSTSSTVRSPLKNIQGSLGQPQKQPLQKTGGAINKPSPTKTKGKQILEYLQLGQQQKKQALLPGIHQPQPRPQSGLIHPPHHQSHQTIKIYTEDGENGTTAEDKKPKDAVAVEKVETKPQPDILLPLLQPRRSASDFGVIGDKRGSSTTLNSSFGFIPVDKSCTIGGGGSSGGGGGSGSSSIFNISSASSSMSFEDESDNAVTFPFQPEKATEKVEDEEDDDDDDVSWNPFHTSFNVTQGVLGTLQPRGLNSSFTEKFESRLGINSGPIRSDQSIKSDNDENTAPPTPGGGKSGPLISPRKSQPFGGSRGLLGERINPLYHCPEYITEILRYWAKLELKFKIKWDYMERHSEISHKMRTILVDWLVEVVCEYSLNEETLHLTVNYIDRFLSKMNVQRTKLQLVGAAALFIAAKFEETNPPEIADYVFVTDEAYTKEEILQMETLMLTCLEFDLMMPTAHSLALSYCSLLEIMDPTRAMTMYLVDLSLMDGQIFLKFLPTVLAGAAVALARFSFGGAFWDSELQKYCGHRKSTVIPAVRALHTAFFDAPTKSQSSMYEKCAKVRHCSVARAFIPHNGPWDV